MHSITTRISTFSSFLSSVATVLLAFIALSSFVFKYEAPATIDLKDIKVYGGHYSDSYLKDPADFVSAKMDINADFSSLFNWNTKQIFVYVVVDYGNKNFTENKVVVWDRIIRNKKKSEVKVRGQKFKYALTDIGPFMTDNSITATIHWEVVPWIGMFLPGKSTTSFGPYYIQPPQKPKKRKLAQEKEGKKVKNSYNEY
ncbi:signal peptidase 22 kDa subunit [Neoconidiobolus thromboides FSU 785]|nr:signal peptidase 22 kDa subunit [Neoconidiobolus thromboides FSU 785]